MIMRISVLALAAIGVVTCAAAGDFGNSSKHQIHDWDVIDSGDFLPQGWSQDDMDQWYSTSIGSRLIPISWYMALRDENGQKLLSKANFDRLKYIYVDSETVAPNYLESTLSDPNNATLADFALPIGFIADEWNKAEEHGTYSKPSNFKTGTGDKWLSMNCAACHTSKVQLGQETKFIHGAPAMSDFLGLVNGIDEAIQGTLKDQNKFELFARDVLGEGYSEQNKTHLQSELDNIRIWRERVYLKNGKQNGYGYGRLDAVGHILNQVSMLVHKETELPLAEFDPKEEGNRVKLQWPSDAPVDYPHIWNTSQQELLQWNGVAATQPVKILKNKYDFGALGRNTGQVTGVFADVNITSNTEDDGKLKIKAKSSAKVINLLDMEKTLSSLHSPKWPEATQFKSDKDKEAFEIDKDISATGKELFQTHCASCHTHLEPDEVKTKLPAKGSEETGDKIVMNWITDVGTDIWMACNSDQFGVTRDLRENLIPNVAASANPNEGEILPDQNPNYFGASMLTDVIKGSILSQAGSIVKKIVRDLFFGGGSRVNTEPSMGSGEKSLFKPDYVKINKAQTCMAKSKLAFEGGLEEKYLAAKADYDRMGFFAKIFKPGKKKTLKKNRDNTKMDFEKHSQLRYKARPLNGIWATAPYLHNGSVPTLYDLLLPPEDHDGSNLLGYPTTKNIPEYESDKTRPNCFYVGSLNYDPKNVGFSTPPCSAHSNTPEGMTKFETSKLGNSNAGHNYPLSELTETERRALVEYMKDL